MTSTEQKTDGLIDEAVSHAVQVGGISRVHTKRIIGAYLAALPPVSRELDIEQLIHMADDCKSLIVAGLQRDALYSIDSIKQTLTAHQQRRKD